MTGSYHVQHFLAWPIKSSLRILHSPSSLAGYWYQMTLKTMCWTKQSLHHPGALRSQLTFSASSTVDRILYIRLSPLVCSIRLVLAGKSWQLNFKELCKPVDIKVIDWKYYDWSIYNIGTGKCYKPGLLFWGVILLAHHWLSHRDIFVYR